MVPIYEKIMDQIKAAVIIGELPKPGCITGLVGQNGAGKTTTFKSIHVTGFCDGSIHVPSHSYFCACHYASLSV